jgi:glycosyltransferase involved in cell wall biosynthesis
MKICYITAEYPPLMGGVGDYVRHLSRKMVARRHDVTVVTSDGLGLKPPAEENGSPRVLAVIRKWNLLGLPRLLGTLKAVDADVYVLEYVVYMYGRGGVAPWLFPFFWAFKRRVKRPLVLNVHETFRPKRRGLKGTVLSYISFLIFKAAVKGSKLAVVTNAYRERLVSRLSAGDPRRVVRIPVGANILPVNGRKRRYDSARNLRVATFGIWNGDRALEDVVRAVGSMTLRNSIRLSIVGAFGNDADRVAGVRRLCAESGLAGRVEITGSLPPGQVSDYLSRTDVFVSPEAGGPSGRRGSLLAALAHGLPVVAYDGREREGVFRDGDNIVLVPEGDVAALAVALDRLAADGVLRRALGARARATFEERFAWPRIAELWDREVFAPLAASRRRGRVMTAGRLVTSKE